MSRVQYNRSREKRYYTSASALEAIVKQHRKAVEYYIVILHLNLGLSCIFTLQSNRLYNKINFFTSHEDDGRGQFWVEMEIDPAAAARGALLR